MNGLPALKLWQAPDMGNILRNIAAIKGTQLRSRLAQIGEARAGRQETRDIEALNLRRGATKAKEERAKAGEEREVKDWELKRALETSEILLSSAQLVLRTAQRSPKEAQKAHDIAIKTLAEMGIDTADIPEEWGPEAAQGWQETAQEVRPFVAYLLALEEKKKKPTARQKEFDRYKEAHPEFKGDIVEFERVMKEAGRAEEKPPSLIAQYKLAQEQGYKGTFTAWKKEVAEAGAPSMTQIIGAEKFEIRKAQTAATLRTDLLNQKDDNKFFEANADLFNKINEKNEVAYWDSPPKGVSEFDAWKYDEETKIIKLTKKNIEDGWTPEAIQEFAKKNNMTVKEVLQRLETIK